MNIETERQNLEQFKDFGVNLTNEINKVLVGQETMINRMLTGILAGGHVLIEGMPGLAKTTAVKVLAESVDTGFSRIQFTPDMLPSDIVGTEIFNPKEATYSIKKGPIFSNLVLADEINRAPAKVQAALLETMQERQATIGGQTYKMDQPFMVLATQNPIDQEGTYPLPEAQVDRFMLKIKVGYPNKDEERKILDRMTISQAQPTVNKVTNPEEIFAARQMVDQVFVDDKVRNYIVDVVQATRVESGHNPAEVEGMIEHGASPRASIFLKQGAKGHAFLQGRNYITPHDVKTLAPDVLRHRIMLSYEAEAEGKSPDDIIQAILDSVLVP